MSLRPGPFDDVAGAVAAGLVLEVGAGEAPAAVALALALISVRG